MKNFSFHKQQISTQNNNPASQSEDLVLQQFYQQRKKRQQISGKRHSLLQKKSSYFSNSRSSVMQSINTQKSESDLCEDTGHKILGMSRGTIVSHQGIGNNNEEKDKKSMTLNSTLASNAQAEIKGRMNKVSEAQILSKYINANANTYSRNSVNKQNKTVPTTPSYHPKNCKQGSFFSKKNNSQILLEASPITNSKSNERRKSLIEMQQNFKNLTGQQFSFIPSNSLSTLTQSKKQLNQPHLSIPLSQSTNSNINIKQKLQNYIQKTRNTASIESSGLRNVLQSNLSSKDQNNDEKSNEVVYSSNDIKIINRTRSQSQSQKQKYDGHSSGQKNIITKELQKVKGNSRKKQDKNNKISIQQVIQNHSFCNKFQKHQESSQQQKQQSQFSKYIQKQDEPLLVLAHQTQHQTKKTKQTNYKSHYHQYQQNNEQALNQSEYSKYDDINQQYNNNQREQNQVSSPNFRMCENYQEQTSELENSLVRQFNKKQLYAQYRSKANEKYHQSNNKSGSTNKDNSHILCISCKSNINPSQFQVNSFQTHTHTYTHDTQLLKQLQKTKQKVEQLQKLTKKQNKFIDSIQNMRKVLIKQQKNCSLKQLWRWVKILPNYQYENMRN